MTVTCMICRNHSTGTPEETAEWFWDHKKYYCKKKGSVNG